MPVTRSQTLFALVAAMAFAAPGAAIAAGKHSGGHGAAAAVGEPGTSSEINRTIQITMRDNHFEPEAIAIAAGETIRFVIKNEGELLHEFNIGTATMHAEHQEEMLTMAEHGMITADKIDHERMKMDHSAMGMHDDPNSVLLEPGKSQELIWKFTKAAELEFACNVPGHYDAGMMGKFSFPRGKTDS